MQEQYCVGLCEHILLCCRHESVSLSRVKLSAVLFMVDVHFISTLYDYNLYLYDYRNSRYTKIYLQTFKKSYNIIINMVQNVNIKLLFIILWKL